MDVRVEGLRVERQGRLVLEIDELTIPGGKISAVLGRNGAGKTTLLRVLSGLLRPSAGSVRLGEMMLWPSPPPSARPSLAFQEPVFLRGTVRDNLELALSLRGVGEAERRTRAEEAARDLEVLHLLDRPARELSRGEGQRVSLARALSLRAPLTLLDEPLGALDAMVRARLLHELPRLLRARGGTAMIVTHDREEAFFLADYLIVLIGGRVRAAGDAGSRSAGRGERRSGCRRVSFRWERGRTGLKCSWNARWTGGHIIRLSASWRGRVCSPERRSMRRPPRPASAFPSRRAMRWSSRRSRSLWEGSRGGASK
ncbi:MAG: ATP-binding cassette domain-containing protein [Polyangiaceae bacterium]|nr:ATP-binding cassette domain-containing protein [Polyangiaceae bacterium]